MVVWYRFQMSYVLDGGVKWSWWQQMFGGCERGCIVWQRGGGWFWACWWCVLEKQSWFNEYLMLERRLDNIAEVDLAGVEVVVLFGRKVVAGSWCRFCWWWWVLEKQSCFNEYLMLERRLDNMVEMERGCLELFGC